MKKRIFLGATLVSLSGAALAQLGGGFPGGGFPGGRRSRGGAGTGDGRDKGKGGELQKPQVNMLETALFEFHEDLKLRQEQETAWQRYADSVRAISSDRERQQRLDPRTEPVTLLQRLDRAVDAARNRFAALEDAADRARALYQVLAPEQQKMADPRLVNLVFEAAGQSSAQMRRAS
ncbi:MAG: Spy/CpxP family protein refolding chaperone [Clostridia bacterium]